MKIRNPYLIKVVGFLAALVVRLWMRTMRYGLRSQGPAVVDPSRPDFRGPYLYVMWHEGLLQPLYRYRGLGIGVLISRHADGQVLAEVCRYLNFRPVRGSTSRGGVEAALRLIRAGRGNNLAITPDGPRGPRRRVQPGVVYLASQMGMPIVAVGVGYDRPWRFRSWDRFACPRPGSRNTCVLTAPIEVPADADRDQLEQYRRLVEDTLHAATEAAERWAETGESSVVRGPSSVANAEEARAAGPS